MSAGAAGPEQMMTDASLAVAQEPPWSPWRDQALYVCAEAHLLAGDVEEARACSRSRPSWRPQRETPDVHILCEAYLAWLAMDRGLWAQAAGHVEGALAAIEESRMHDYVTSVLAFAGAARLAVQRGDRTEADSQLTRAMRARPSLTYALPSLAVRVRLQLAKVYWAIGDQTAARHLLRDIDDVLLHRPALGALLDEVSELRGILTSSQQAGTVGRSPLLPRSFGCSRTSRRI
jgi:LuxR family transcriptional regulator, maltose regulon positive regulatory protein